MRNKRPESSKDTAVIFVPGFKGSRLKDESGTVWITATKALTNGATLELPIATLPGGAGLSPDGVLRRVPIIPGLLGYEVYGPLLDRLSDDLPSARILEFGYDWRLDNEGTIERLAALVDNLHANGVPNIHIVAHSMGSLVTAYYLRYGGARFDAARETWAGAAKVKSVTFAGAPFLGSLETLHDIQFGEATFRNKTLLSSRSLASFPSMYQLLPAPGVCAVTPCGNHDLYAPEFWSRNAWGIYSQPEFGDDLLRRQFLERQLAQSSAFFQLLHAPAAMAAPASLKIVNVLSSKHTTPAQVNWDRGVPADEEEYNARLAFDDGDGVVTQASALLPAAYRPRLVEQIESAAPHQNLYDDKRTYGSVVRLIEGY